MTENPARGGSDPARGGEGVRGGGAPADRNIVWSDGQVSAEERARRFGQRGCVLWLTGLSGSGKSTIAHALEKELLEAGHAAYVLDGDNVRHGLNSDLGFGPEDRDENIRRIGEVAALFADAGLIAITAFISPYRAGRRRARDAAGAGRFLEVFVDAPVAECEKRDPKGLYARARSGEIAEFTGVSAPYEAPEAPDVHLRTAGRSVEDCVGQIVEAMGRSGLFHP
jgi:adenylylsulfate kinase